MKIELCLWSLLITNTLTDGVLLSFYNRGIKNSGMAGD